MKMFLCSSSDGVPLKFNIKICWPPVYQYRLFEPTLGPSWNFQTVSLRGVFAEEGNQNGSRGGREERGEQVKEVW
jgi:hypothetical protein